MTPRILLALAFFAAAPLRADDKPAAPRAVLMQQAFHNAAVKVAPSVVTIEVAELDLIEDEPKPKAKAKIEVPDEPKDPADPKAPKDKKDRKKAAPEEPMGHAPEFLRAEDAPTTGLVIDADGWVLTSTFNLGKRPKFVKVRLADGREFPATVTARDHSRGIALLKIPAKDLPVPEIADPAEARVGQWTLALGRSFGGKLPSVQYGILSAKERIMGRALQTDCALSPANYGGPLIDIGGRVLAINVPLSPDGDVIETGLYDSGIGFAVPVADVTRRLDRLKKGEDLHPGFLGVLFEADKGGGAEIKDVVKDGPAAKGGLQKGDLVTHVAGAAVDSTYKFRYEIGKRLAGDTVELTVKRKDQRLKLPVVLGKRG